MKNKPLTRFKFENIIFITLVIMYLYGATTRIPTPGNPFGVLSNFYTLVMQIGMSYAIKFGFRYIRKNPQTIADEWSALFKD